MPYKAVRLLSRNFILVIFNCAGYRLYLSIGAPIGMTMLEAAHKNDIELEGTNSDACFFNCFLHILLNPFFGVNMIIN